MPAKKPAKPSGAVRKRTAQSLGLAGALAESSWAGADGALAEALLEFEALGEARNAAARKEATLLLGQALNRVARKRGILRFGTPGSIEPYDDARHALNKTSRRKPTKISVIKAGVARGAEILAPARVAPVAARRRK